MYLTACLMWPARQCGSSSEAEPLAVGDVGHQLAGPSVLATIPTASMSTWLTLRALLPAHIAAVVRVEQWQIEQVGLPAQQQQHIAGKSVQ
jgi:hypothetical protein